MSEMEMEHNQIENVEIKITFLDGTTRDFGEGDVSGSFSEWLSDINWEYKNEMESKYASIK
jgi:hypothetical protein